MIDFLIGHTQDSESARTQMGITLGIVFDLCFVNAAVHFNDQGVSMTIKISEIAINNLLPAKMQAV